MAGAFRPPRVSVAPCAAASTAARGSRPRDSGAEDTADSWRGAAAARSRSSTAAGKGPAAECACPRGFGW